MPYRATTKQPTRFVIMNKQNRRAFLQTSAGALAVGLNPAALASLRASAGAAKLAAGASPAQTAQSVASNEGKKPLRLGLIIGVGKDPDRSEEHTSELQSL